MIIRSLDKDNDWVFGKGKSDYKRSQLAFNQHLKTRLLEWKGDCFFDNNAGIDWKNRLDKRSQIPFLRNEIKTLILKTDGIKEVVELDINFNSINRKLTINYNIKTVYSSATESGNLII